jgi:uncharacterized protein YbjT (DUF2867 family)
MATKVLIIGATGFVGSNLLNYFEKKNIQVRVLARNISKVIKGADSTEVVYGDLDKIETIKKALVGIDCIYYLAHAMAELTDEFVTREIVQAQNLSSFLKVKHKVIYLGGILPDEKLSMHLEARKAVGEVLRKSSAQTIEFRASIIIGNGSASFEIVRSIVNKLPLIISASWSKSKCQPIALVNVVDYLYAASNSKLKYKDVSFDIGGPDVISYDELLTKYASFKKLYRPNLYISKFPKKVALDVLKVVASEYYQVGHRLIESIEHETILKDNKAAAHFEIAPLNIQESFDLLGDDLVSKVEISKFFDENLSKELPEYLVGESIQIFIPVLDNNIEKFFSDKFVKIKQFKVSAENFITQKSYEFRIPKVGRFKFTYNKAKSGIHLVVMPEFFFQSLGITILKKIISL